MTLLALYLSVCALERESRLVIVVKPVRGTERILAVTALAGTAVFPLLELHAVRSLVAISTSAAIGVKAKGRDLVDRHE